jgi:hypothetical protein
LCFFICLTLLLLSFFSFVRLYISHLYTSFMYFFF